MENSQTLQGIEQRVVLLDNDGDDNHGHVEKNDNNDSSVDECVL